ncbi:MAG TPA: cytochrome c biogenesis protein CcsA [Chitinophagaceae bacterium]|nr:cytochrome c biogenesis protein CcsA [Chitinophagaceae bacterium]
MDYIGEHLMPGQFGHFFIVLSLVASFIATFAYFKSANAKTDADKESWKRLARGAFFADVIGVFATIVLLIYINFNHLFEYKYAWQHSSLSLEAKYLLACVWEGQEGSFLLWTFWHCMLGLFLIRGSKQWEAPVMTVISFAQFALATMIIGFYFFGERIGSNPFVLLRNESAGPIFSRPDYLTFIKDGNDLNPLLQNYWMVIHPPVLFLGFASTIVPFAFAFAGLWKNKLGDWTKPALPWALFSAAVLGLGVMMGGMWAYESLTFGGYWAWDPVENASMVPWLTLVAGIHTLLIYKHTGRALKATYLFFIFCFGLVLYSTFLTRTGILGDTSVHAFTGEGNSLFYHLIILMIVFLVPAFVLFFRNYKNIPTVQQEESTSSREFWMFIGSLVLFLAGLVIIGKTSVPVVNKMFGTNIAAPEDVEFAYNRVQIFVAIVVGALTAITQYLKYRQTAPGFFRKKILAPTIVSIVLASLILAFGNINYDKHGAGFLAAIWLAVVSSVYAAVANLSYIWIGMKGKLKLSGGSITHLGFALMLIGILISSSKKEILSYNTSGIFFNFGEGSKENPGENLTLIKGVPMDMGKYMVTYVSDSANPKKPLWYYKIHFKSKDGKEEFNLMPNAFVNYKGNEGLMANPDSKHYWDHDVFTYITSLPDPEKNKDTAQFKERPASVGDTIFYSKGFMVLERISSRDDLPTDIFDPGDAVYDARVKIFSKNNTSYTAEPKLAFTKGTYLPIPDTVAAESLVLQLNKVDGQKAELGVKESTSVMDYVTLKAYKFPFIRVLWLGVIVMVAGFLVSVMRRNELNRLNRQAENLDFSKQQNT